MYRFYSFVNYYLSPLQYGLQTAHCVSEMSVAVGQNTAKVSAYNEWARFDKTIIICNGGNQASLENLFTRLVGYGKEFGLPVTKFNEDEVSLNGALTAVAIIVPQHFYDVTFDHRQYGNGVWTCGSEDSHQRSYEAGTSEFEFISLLKSFRLA